MVQSVQRFRFSSKSETKTTAYMPSGQAGTYLVKKTKPLLGNNILRMSVPMVSAGREVAAAIITLMVNAGKKSKFNNNHAGGDIRLEKQSVKCDDKK